MIEGKELEKIPTFIYASFSQRLIAYIIDILLINATTSVILNIYQLLGFSDSGLQFGLFNLTGLFLYFAYFSLITKFTNGQTIGKMVMGLRVLSLHRTDLSWSDVLTRELVGRYIQKKIIFLYFLYFITKRKQTLADIFTDTVIISEGAYLDLKEYMKKAY